MAGTGSARTYSTHHAVSVSTYADRVYATDFLHGWRDGISDETARFDKRDKLPRKLDPAQGAYVHGYQYARRYLQRTYTTLPDGYTVLQVRHMLAARRRSCARYLQSCDIRAASV